MATEPDWNFIIPKHSSPSDLAGHSGSLEIYKGRHLEHAPLLQDKAATTPALEWWWLVKARPGFITTNSLNQKLQAVG